jgi:hypothetical protein
MRCSKLEQILYALILAACAITVTACTTVTTAVKLKNPSQTSLSFRRAGRTTIRPIDQGKANIEGNLASLDVKVPAAIRRQNLALLLDCAQCESGNKTYLSESGLTAAAPTTASELIETRKTQKGRLRLEYLYAVNSTQNLSPVLETRWSNAEYFEENREPITALGWLLAPGGLLTAAGVYFLFQSPAAGIAFLLPGLALDTWGVWQLVMKPTTVRLDLDGKPIAPPAAKIALNPKRVAEESAVPAKAEEPSADEEPKKTISKESTEKAEPEPAQSKEKAKLSSDKSDKKPPQEKIEKPTEEKPSKSSNKKPSQSSDEDKSNKDSKPSKSPSKGNEKLEDFLL